MAEIDWTGTMQRSYKYYEVDPVTWLDSTELTDVKSNNISFDSSADTLGSASFEVTSDWGERYVRVYMQIIQNGITFKRPLGTFLVQSPSVRFDGFVHNISVDAYTPLIELKEKRPPIGYYVPKNTAIIGKVASLASENMRGPVIEISGDKTLFDDFIADTNEDMLSYLKALASKAEYKFNLDPMGSLIFEPYRTINEMNPRWTYTDDNASILYPEITTEADMYGVPNVVEIIYSGNGTHDIARVRNDDPESPSSTVARGREIVYREVNPSGLGNPTYMQLQEYARHLLERMSTLTCTISYKHGYCPVRVGDCVRLNYTRAGLVDIKAMVISQQIDCTPDAQVSETATFVKKLWGDSL